MQLSSDLIGKVASILLVLVLGSAISFRQSKSDQDVVIGKLKNGFTYYLLPEESQGKLTVRVLSNTGSYVESPSERGMAHLLEHMVFKGSKKFPGEKAIESLELLGLRFGKEYNASTNKTETNYYFNIPPEDTQKLKGLLTWIRESMFDLQMEEESFEIEKRVVIEEIGSGKGTINPYLVGTLLDGHNGLGTPEEVASVQFRDLQDFYNRFYTTSQMALVIQGEIDRNLAQKYIEQVFESVKKTAPAPKNKYPDVSNETIVSSDFQPSRQDKYPVLALAFKVQDTPLNDYALFKRDVVRGIFCELLENRLISSSDLINRKTTLYPMDLVPGTSMFNLRLTGNQDVSYRDLLIEFTKVINQAKKSGFSPEEVEFFFNRRWEGIKESQDEKVQSWANVKENFLTGEPLVSKSERLQWMEQLHQELPEFDFEDMLVQMIQKEKTVFFDGSTNAFDTDFTKDFILEKLEESQDSLDKAFEFIPPQKSFVVKSEFEPISPKVEEMKPAKIIQRKELGDQLYLLKYENGAKVVVFNSPFAPTEIKMLAKRGLNQIPVKDRSAMAAAIDLLKGSYASYSTDEVSEMERSLGIRKKTEISDFEFEYSLKGDNSYVKEMLQVFYLSIAKAGLPDSKDFLRKYTSRQKKGSVDKKDYESFMATLNGSSLPKGDLPDFSEELVKRLFDYRTELVQDLSSSVFYLGGDLPDDVDDLISGSIGNLLLSSSEKSKEQDDSYFHAIVTPSAFEFHHNRELPLVEHYFGKPAETMSFKSELVNEAIAQYGYAKIYEILRRKYGYIYVMGTTSYVEKYPKPFNSLSFRFIVDSSNIEKATRVIQQEVLDPMRKGDISSKDLVIIKEKLESSYVLNFYDPELLSGAYLRWLLKYNEAISIQELIKSIHEISKNEVSMQMKALIRLELQMKILRYPNP